MNHLHLHTEPNRHEVFAASHGRPTEFDRMLQAWIVLDPEVVTAILRDRRILACPIVDAFALIEARYGVQVPNLSAVAKLLPLGLEGRPHQMVRRQMANLLSNGQERMTALLPQIIDRHFAPLAHSTEVEIVTECVVPFVAELFSQILDSPQTIPFRPRTIGRIFDRFASVGAHRAIDAELAALRTQLVALGVEDPDLTLAFLMIGRDSLLSTLSESLAEIAGSGTGQALRDITFPQTPPQTGVSVTERMVGEDLSIGGQELRKGDRLRLYFQGYAHLPTEPEKLLMFGTGLHSCLGRGLSLDAWQALVAWLARVPRRMELVGYAVHPDPIFTMPEYVRVKLG
jgi:cytochrome P450